MLAPWLCTSRHPSPREQHLHIIQGTENLSFWFLIPEEKIPSWMATLPRCSHTSSVQQTQKMAFHQRMQRWWAEETLHVETFASCRTSHTANQIFWLRSVLQ